MDNTQTTFDAAELKARFNPDGSPLRRQQMVMLEMVKELKKRFEPVSLKGWRNIIHM